MIETHHRGNNNLLLNSIRGIRIGAGFGIIVSVGYFAIVAIATFLTNTSPNSEMINKYGIVLGYLSYLLGVVPWFLLGIITIGIVTILPYTLIGVITGLFISLTFSSIENPISSRTAIFIGITISIILSVAIHFVACTYADLCINSMGYYIFIGYPALVHVLSGGCMGWVLLKGQK